MTRRPALAAPLNRSQGFGLIELLVVISIIALFIGVSFGAYSYIRAQAEQESAYALLTQALGAEVEYKAQTRQVMVDSAIDLSALLGAQAQTNAPDATGTAAVGNMDKSIEVFVWQALSLPAAEDMLRAAAGTTALVDSDGDGFLELQDPWGNTVEYRASNDGSETDFPRHGAPFLASPGPDGVFGTYTNTNEPDDEARDNVLSYELK
ncbi:MAG: prepilin-type N-terminal cleavage/methylation domain-containing protein [Planctomycetota bacterium]